MTKSRSVFVVSALVLVLILGAIIYLNQKVSRNPDLYLIPSGYVGLITINFEKDGAPALAREGSYTVYTIPEDGILSTSASEPKQGWSSDKFYYVDNVGTRQELDPGNYIHGYSIGKDDKGQISQHLFVGSNQQYKDFIEAQEEKNKNSGS